MRPSLPAQAAPAAARPTSLSDLFWSFSWLALQGFGGVLAVVQRELVEKKRWLTLEEFVEDWAAAQVLPGPNVINLALMIGGRHFGLLATAWLLASALNGHSRARASWLLTLVCMLIVWRTHIHLLWLLSAGALLGAFGWV